MDDRRAHPVLLRRDVGVVHILYGREEVVNAIHSLSEDFRDEFIASDGRSEDLDIGNRAN